MGRILFFWDVPNLIDHGLRPIDRMIEAESDVVLKVGEGAEDAVRPSVPDRGPLARRLAHASMIA